MDEVEEIKSKLDIVDFINHYVTLKKAGSNYKALCPFHQEKTPSFMVSGEKQIFKCFGCNEGGDVIEFLMKYENLEFKEALELLADKVGVPLKKFEARSTKFETNSKSQLFQINMAVAQLWHKILMTHPAGRMALQYLRGRKMSDQTTKNWLIGYAPSQDTTRTFLTKRGYSAEQIKAAGSPDKFFKRIMFPLFDVIGNVVAFTGRATQDQQEPKYLNTPETNLYHKSRFLYGLNFAKPAIKQLDQVLIVEGQMDVVLSHQAGVTNVVATSGTALTTDHLVILARYTPNLVFAFDNDEAGLKATKTAIEQALDLELTIRVVKLPQSFKDVGEVVEKNPALWQKLARQALPWMEYLMPNVQFGSVEQKKKVAKEILPFLARVRDPIEQAHWTKRLASSLNVNEEAIVQALSKFETRNPKSETKTIQTNKPQLSLKEELYGLLLVFPEFQNQYKVLFERLKKWYNKDTKELEFLLKDRYQKTSPADIERALSGLYLRIKEQAQQKVKDDFARQIAQAEQAGDRQKIKALFKKLQDSLK